MFEYFSINHADMLDKDKGTVRKCVGMTHVADNNNRE